MSTAAPQKRGRRYGSDYARAWARGLHFGDVRTKATLNAVCNYVDEDGSCWPSIGTLADDTDQSEDSVRRRLVVLENLAVIARFARWRDDKGKVNYDGNGRRTTDEIRLLFDVSQDDIDAKNSPKGGDSSGDSDAIPDEISPSQQQGLIEPAPSTLQGSSPSHQQGGRSHCSDLQYEPSLDPISPQSPSLSNDTQAAVATSNEAKGTIAYERFTEVYGEGSVRPQQSRALWDSLLDSERELAINGARGYRAQRLSTKKALIDPERYLRNRDLWTEFAAMPSAQHLARIEIDADGDPGRALLFLHKLAKVPRPVMRETAGKSLIYLRAQPASCVLALLRSPPEKEWGIVDPGSQEFGAWREFVATHTGKGLTVHTIIVGARYETDAQGKQNFSGNDLREGVKVPAPFPPRVDGSWPEVDNALAQKTG